MHPLNPRVVYDGLSVELYHLEVPADLRLGGSRHQSSPQVIGPAPSNSVRMRSTSSITTSRDLFDASCTRIRWSFPCMPPPSSGQQRCIHDEGARWLVPAGNSQVQPEEAGSVANPLVGP